MKFIVLVLIYQINIIWPQLNNRIIKDNSNEDSSKDNFKYIFKDSLKDNIKNDMKDSRVCTL